MGVFDKLTFWKKKDEFDLGGDFGKDLDLKGADLGLGQDLGKPEDLALGNDFPSTEQGLASEGFGGFADFSQKGIGRQSPQRPGFDQFAQPVPMQQPFGGIPQHNAGTADIYGKDLEVVSAKLDSIRYTLESINQRLANLERIAHGENERNQKGW